MQFESNAEDLFATLSTHPAVVVHFDAPWNGPAPMNRRRVEAMAKECCPQLHVVSMDIDDPRNSKLHEDLKLLSVPFFAIYVDGELQSTQIGLRDGIALQGLLQKAQVSIPWFW